MPAKRKTAKPTKKRAATQAKSNVPHPCSRCGGTGKFKNFGPCYACNGTGITTKQQRGGASKWRGGGNVNNLCQARRTVQYTNGDPDMVLFCYEPTGHDCNHQFRPKKADRNGNECGNPVAYGDATFPCGEDSAHKGACTVSNSVLAAAGHLGGTDVHVAPAPIALRGTPDEKRGNQAEAGWSHAQREDLDGIVALFKD